MPMAKPIELRSKTNEVIFQTNIDVVDEYPEIIHWNNADFILKAVYKTSGLASYRQATVHVIDPPLEQQQETTNG